jgi:hypothetical protein
MRTLTANGETGMDRQNRFFSQAQLESQVWNIRTEAVPRATPSDRPFGAAVKKQTHVACSDANTKAREMQ